MRIIALMVNVYNNLSLANLFEICSIQLICARQGKTFFRLLQSRRSSSYCFLRFILIIFVCLCGFIGRSIHFERENVGPRHPSNWKSFAFSLSILISLFCWSFSVYKRRNVECVANESKLIFFCFSSSSLFFFGYKEKMCLFFVFFTRWKKLMIYCSFPKFTAVMDGLFGRVICPVNLNDALFWR